MCTHFVSKGGYLETSEFGLCSYLSAAGFPARFQENMDEVVICIFCIRSSGIFVRGLHHQLKICEFSGMFCLFCKAVSRKREVQQQNIGAASWINSLHI